MKKILAVLLALVSVFSLSVAGSAAVAEADAKAVAFADAGIREADAFRVTAVLDYDDGVQVWEVEFHVNIKGGYVEYDYEINAADGAILEKSTETKTITPPPASGTSVDAAAAKAAAFADAQVAAADVVTVYAHTDYEDDVKCWDIEFTVAVPGGYIEYDYEIRAADGAILDKDSERKGGAAPAQGSGEIDKNAALLNARQAFSANGIELMELEFDGDHYEIEFRTGLDAKYSCDVNAITGEVYDMETENCNTLPQKLELLFEIISAYFKNLFRK